jgi:protein TonB
MNRYLKSFIITVTIYVVLFISFVLFSHNFKKHSLKTQKVVNIKIINFQPVKKIANLEPKKEPIKEEIKPQEKESTKEEIELLKREKVIEKKIEPIKEIKKDIKPIKKEKIVKKVPIKKSKKILKKHSKKPKKVVKKTHKKIKKSQKVTKKRYTKSKKRGKKYQKRAKVKSSTNSSISNTSYVSTKASSATNYNFLSNLIRRINQNKSYPPIAIRRRLSGEVTIHFTILPSGNVGNISADGSRIFANSAIRAVRNSFPIDVSGAPFSLPKNVSFTMRFILR